MVTDEKQYVIVEMKDELRCEGVLEQIDKVNLLIYLANAKTYLIGEKGEIIPKGTFESLKLNKGDIKVIKLVQIDKSKKIEPVKEEHSGIKPIPKTEAEATPIQKPYEKDNFFDNMSSTQAANTRSIVKIRTVRRSI
jgi:small nuclear ribonucleoprotein (snRNP)-like protein